MVDNYATSVIIGREIMAKFRSCSACNKKYPASGIKRNRSGTVSWIISPTLTHCYFCHKNIQKDIRTWIYITNMENFISFKIMNENI